MRLVEALSAGAMHACRRCKLGPWGRQLTVWAVLVVCLRVCVTGGQFASAMFEAAQRVPVKDHLRRAALCDVALDTLHYNMGATGDTSPPTPRNPHVFLSAILQVAWEMVHWRKCCAYWWRR